ncbi:MAG: transcriptional repressor LexA [Bacillota bacterium]
MRDNLSDRQEQILNFIMDEIRSKGIPPTVREIGSAVGLKSSSSVYSHLVKLEKMKYIRRDSTKPRAIEVIDEEGNNIGLTAERTVTTVPILGDITAGEPILAVEEYDETFPVPNEFINDSNKYFMLKVDGESMINAGIYDSDYILVEQTTIAKDGDIIVALTDDNESTVKRFFKEKDKYKLQPENETMDPIYLDNVEIIGQVKGVFRKM